MPCEQRSMSLKCSALLVNARVQGAHVGQVAVALGKVQAIAHNELVGDVKADLGQVCLLYTSDAADDIALV